MDRPGQRLQLQRARGSPDRARLHTNAAVRMLELRGATRSRDQRGGPRHASPLCRRPGKSLEPVLPDIAKTMRAYHMVVHADLLHLPRVRTVTNYIDQKVTEARALFVPSPI